MERLEDDELLKVFVLVGAVQSRFRWPVLPQLWHFLVSCLVLGKGFDRGLPLARLLNERLLKRVSFRELEVRVRVLV